MNSAAKAVVQLAIAALFWVGVAYFSVSPRYEYVADEIAIIKLSVSHAADRVTPCVQLSPQEIAALPPNERRPAKCERERVPLTLQLDVDDQTRINIEAEPSGLWNDGPASVYQTIAMAPGSYRVTARLRDSSRGSGWDYEDSKDIDLEAGRYLTVTFRAESGGFEFR